jgi:hypothetical protein
MYPVLLKELVGMLLLAMRTSAAALFTREVNVPVLSVKT